MLKRSMFQTIIQTFSLFKLQIQTIRLKLVRFKPGAWSRLGANGQPGSMAIGNILMLLMKPPIAQGGSASVFHTEVIAGAGDSFREKQNHSFPAEVTAEVPAEVAG